MRQITHRAKQGLLKKYDDTPSKILGDISDKDSNFWMHEREQTALRVFHTAAQCVPAYKDFLKKNRVKPSDIKTFKDFQEKVPVTSKKNYLLQYSLDQLSLGGHLIKPLVFTSTSGSTGEPFYFSRGNELDWQSSIAHELYFRNGTHGTNKSTLVIICFGMGVWIGGLITYQAFKLLGERGYPISIITPGINKEEIFKTLKKLAPNFEQVILAGYAPFIKDIVDEASSRKIVFKNVRLLFAAEAFTENFRDYLAKKTSINNVLLDTMNIYGSADIGTMAFETPLSILVRRLAIKKRKLFSDIFTFVHKTPTLAQYNPSFIVFESPKGEILLTGNNSLPLVRYSIGDHGGQYSYREIEEKCREHGVNITNEAEKASIENKLYQLPFVYVYERMDFSTTLYGLQIYPETIKEVLIKKPFSNYLTGKMTLVTRFDNNQNQYLEINLELQRNKNAGTLLKKHLLSKVVENLRNKSSEFHELSNYLKEKADPKLIFWSCEDPLHFKPGVKQKWVKK